MSEQPLADLASGRALRHAPGYVDLARLHVPFDSMPATSLPSGSTEARLTAAVLAHEQVAVVGGTGSGKSSLVSYVTLRGGGEGIVAFRVPVRFEDPAVISTPGGFARHALEEVSRLARRARQISNRDRVEAMAMLADRTAPRRGPTLGFSINPAALLGTALGAQINAAAGNPDAYPRSATVAIERLREVLEVVAKHDKVPVLVVDDSDAWHGNEERTAAAARFFTEIPRVLADLPCGAVLAVHDRQQREPWWYDADHLSRVVRVPRLTHPDQLGAILEHRIQRHRPDLALDDVVTPQSVDRLFGAYRGELATNVRAAVLVANRSLNSAADEGRTCVERLDIERSLTAHRSLPTLELEGPAVDRRSVPALSIGFDD